MEAFSQQDEQIRAALNRRGRVNELKYKAQAQLGQSGLQSSERRSNSPGRNTKTSGYSQRKSPVRKY